MKIHKVLIALNVAMAIFFSGIALACTKITSYETWYKKGIVKLNSDNSVTCDSKKIGVRNCENAMAYVYAKYKAKK